MPIPVRERVLAAIEAALVTLSGIAFHRNRRSPIETIPALLMAEEGHEVAATLTGATLHRQFVRIDCIAGGGDDAGAGPALSDLIALVQAAVFADPSLGGIAVDVEEQPSAETDLDREPGHAPHMAIGLRLAITYLTRTGDPYSLGP